MPRRPRTCPCGTPFTSNSSMQKYCCPRCAIEARRTRPTRTSGDKHGRRTSVTKTNVRKAVAERDGDWCLLCGTPPKGLHLHRVRYGSEGGRYATDNCVQLCGPHHDVVHSSKAFWKPLLLELLSGAIAPAQVRERQP